MGLYKSKPVYVNAFKVGVDIFPIWFKKMLDAEEIAFSETLGAYYPTPDGVKVASIGDFLIKNDAGEISSMKPDNFLKTYEYVPHGGTYEIPVRTVKKHAYDDQPAYFPAHPHDEGDTVYVKE